MKRFGANGDRDYSDPSNVPTEWTYQYKYPDEYSVVNRLDVDPPVKQTLHSIMQFVFFQKNPLRINKSGRGGLVGIIKPHLRRQVQDPKARFSHADLQNSTKELLDRGWIVDLEKVQEDAKSVYLGMNINFQKIRRDSLPPSNGTSGPLFV